MPLERKRSQARQDQLLTAMPPLPASAPRELVEWYSAFKGALDEDRETIEAAFADIRKQIDGLPTSQVVQVLSSELSQLKLQVASASLPLIQNSHVAPAAAIVESKLALNHATHSTANDPTADEKAALAGTSGTPNSSNKFVTNADPRLGADSSLQQVMALLPPVHAGHDELKAELRREIEFATILSLLY